jgi:hypothetical protein
MLIQQVLTRIRFIWLRELDHQLISRHNIRISCNSDIKISEITIIKQSSITNYCILDPTFLLADKERTSASLHSLRTLTLDLIGETKDALTSTALKRWSAKAIDFLEAMSFSS